MTFGGSQATTSAASRLATLTIGVGVALWAGGASSLPGVADLPVAASADANARPAAGRVRFLRNARSEFDPFILGSSGAERLFIRQHYWRLRGYPPTSDGALGWGPPLHFYADLYALYPSEPADQRLLERHPDWILRDAEGNPLYVPYDCAAGACAAYAADVGNPRWRAQWIKRARIELRKGYKGVFIDNVNLLMRVSDGFGNPVAPIDPRTAQAMAEADWRDYVARFVRRIRRELPRAEITHNVIWFADHSNRSAARQVDAADLIALERGFSEPVIREGDGSDYSDLLAHVDWIHARKRSVLLEPTELDQATRLFELANYFLVNTGGDAIASSYEADPGHWWPGWDTRLGAPLGPRHLDGGVLRRDFQRGVALVNPPGAPQQAVDLGPNYVDLEGAPVDGLTLDPGQGAVLLEAG